jgi:hypothetical protein
MRTPRDAGSCGSSRSRLRLGETSVCDLELRRWLVPLGQLKVSCCVLPLQALCRCADLIRPTHLPALVTPERSRNGRVALTETPMALVASVRRYTWMLCASLPWRSTSGCVVCYQLWYLLSDACFVRIVSFELSQRFEKKL